MSNESTVIKRSYKDIQASLPSGYGRLLPALLLCLMTSLLSAFIPAAAFAALPTPTENCTSTDNTNCKICINEQSSTFYTPSAGANMINQVFTIINKILQKIQSTFYTGIVGSTTFQQIISVVFVMYIAIYGIMITFGLASYRSGEIASRLIKVSIVYAMTVPTGWAFFSTWVQQPIVGGINELITVIANVGGSGGGSGSCISTGVFSGGPITTSGTASNLSISLQTGPMAMLFGPMTCAYGARFMASLQALITTGFFGWLLALMLLWGLLEFTFMLFGAIVTYVKAIIGLTFLFGLAPIFIAFYLFEKTRALTQGWLAMAVGFAVQPVLLFAFLAFYAEIIGTSLAGIFNDNSGNQRDICYVPWYNMPGMVSMYWWRFVNSSGVAGGAWQSTSSGSSAAFSDPLPPPVTILNVLYFIVLCSLGKSFSRTISETALLLSGGGQSGNVVTTGEQIGSWFQTNLMGGHSPTDIAASAVGGAVRRTGSIYDRLFGRGTNDPYAGTMPRAPLRTDSIFGEFGENLGGNNSWGEGDDI